MDPPIPRTASWGRRKLQSHDKIGHRVHDSTHRERCRDQGPLLLPRKFLPNLSQSRIELINVFAFQTGEDESSHLRLPPEVIAADGMVAVIAGSDTTATAMSHLFYFMATNPRYCDKLRDEIDQFFPDDEGLVDFTRLSNMPYLNACL